MRIRKQVGSLIAVLVLTLLGGTAFSKDSRTLNVEHPASVHGAALAAGQYQVTWVTHSPEATVTFKQKGNTVATAEGKMEQRPTRYESNSVLYSTHPDGTRTIMEIRFGGTNQVLTFAETTPTS